MANKNQRNQTNNVGNKSNKNQDTYRNDSELTNKNSYMIYELNNTFNDKNEDILKGNDSGKVNHNIISKK